MKLFELEIKSSKKNYKVKFIDDFIRSLKLLYKKNDFIIIDKFVYDNYVVSHKEYLNSFKFIKIEASEAQKSYLRLAPIIQELIEGGFKKDNRLIAIGGGITQDVTAFIASILYRGVDWYFFPTTLLAQGDSCIGSKTSINFGEYKNQLGNFYAPREIYSDTNFLRTLNEKELTSGLGEMAHYFLVSSEEDYKRYTSEYDNARIDFGVLRDLIIRSLEIKKSYIEIDEFDLNERQVFNYGHSFGHAIESLTQYRIPHGIAVSIGMDIANFMSVNYGYLSAEKRMEIREVLKKIWTGYSLADLSIEEMKNALRKDKKNKGDLLGLILTKGPGKTFKEFKELDSKFSEWLFQYFSEEFYR
ncbi:MAG: hypothetical protein K9J12_17730 [Melioribacteraceae bacterium]|nr:hypothetical protein [Melioribacteraceae bacterium]MCF8263488.1 hypothetical protein [Melioribacteraceae bacterium]